MEFRERRLAQIVRDFMEVYVGAAGIGAALERGDLEFERVERVVGDAEDSVLYRLKEECHALFRPDKSRPPAEVQAEELFDLGVGALFHEAMKFRESFYLASHYGPRLKRTVDEGRAEGPVARTLEKVLDAAHRRIRESAVESAELARETREQLLVVLRQRGDSGAVARSLVERPRRAEAVFDAPLPELLADVYGDAERGFALAIEDLLESGHFVRAGALAARAGVRDWAVCRQAAPFAAGMAAWYSGDPAGAVERLGEWIEAGAPGPAERARRADRALREIAEPPEPEDGDPELARAAAGLAERLAPALGRRPRSGEPGKARGRIG